MPRLPSTSCAPSPTRASRTRVFTGRYSDSHGLGARTRTRLRAEGSNGAPVARGRSAARTSGGADALQVDVAPPHEEHRRRRHGPMSTRSIEIDRDSTRHVGSGRAGSGSEASFRIVSQEIAPLAANA